MQLRASSTVPADIATLMLLDSEMLTIEYKVKFVVPVRGEHAIACGYVLKPDYTTPIYQDEVIGVKDEVEKLCATMLDDDQQVGASGSGLSKDGTTRFSSFHPFHPLLSGCSTTCTGKISIATTALIATLTPKPLSNAVQVDAYLSHLAATGSRTTAFCRKTSSRH